MKTSKQNPYQNLIHKLGSRLKVLQDEIVAESTTNIEFEEYSRQTFDFFTQQIKALKSAFNTLTDVMIEELEQLKCDVKAEISAAFSKSNHRADIIEQDTKKQLQDLRQFKAENYQKTERDVNKIKKLYDDQQRDIDTLLQVVPKVEDQCISRSTQVQSELVSLQVHVSASQEAETAEKTRLFNKCEELANQQEIIRVECDQQRRKLQRDMQSKIDRVEQATTKRIDDFEFLCLGHKLKSSNFSNHSPRGPSTTGKSAKGAGLYGSPKYEPPVKKMITQRSSCGSSKIEERQSGADHSLNSSDEGGLQHQRQFSAVNSTASSLLSSRRRNKSKDVLTGAISERNLRCIESLDRVSETISECVDYSKKISNHKYASSPLGFSREPPRRGFTNNYYQQNHEKREIVR
eukprot:GHVL01033952.1.p1 GENE.GHVL01033952.1~~GHVL01033952.1.p1  ORF type:complete len:405 (-),score=74.24 GHVL01033952.1:761-1975(-)